MARKKTKIRVACLRGVPAAGDLEANWRTFEKFAHLGKKRQADLFISPECFLDGYAVVHAKWGRRQLLAGGRVAAKEYLPRVKRLGRELEMMLLLGTAYTMGKRCYNSAFLIGPDGRRIGRYDKIHAGRGFHPGQRIPVFDTPFGKMGIMICADRRWPEIPRALRVQGAKLILNPSYGMRHLANEWWMRTRSYENECYICFVHPTVSLVTDPWSNVHAKRSGKRQGLLVADIDLSNLPTMKIDTRRPELYGTIVRKRKR